MKITSVQINQVKNSKSKLVAFANITIDEELVIKGFKVVEGKNGVFIGFPNSEGSDGKYYDDVFPLSKECREYMSDTILDKFLKDSSKGKKRR